MLNECSFIGNMGNDPETRAAANSGSSFTTFSIAVNKFGANRDDKPMWVNVAAFGKTGEFVAKYLKKGSRVLVQGSIELQEYEGKDGKNHSSLKMAARQVLHLDKKEDSGDREPELVGAGASKSSKVSDEDIPF